MGTVSPRWLREEGMGQLHRFPLTSLGQNSSVGTRALLGDEGRWKLGGPGPGISQARESGLPGTSREVRRASEVGVEGPGDWRQARRPLPLPCPVLLSLQTLTIKGRERVHGPGAPTWCCNPKVASQASELCGRAPGR